MILILLKLIHVIVCLFLIIVVLLQSGKAADLELKPWDEYLARRPMSLR